MFATTAVLCTATQPALERREGFDPGISASDIRPIVADRARLYDDLRRTRPIEHLGGQSNDDLKIRVLAERRGSLVVVNTTKAAREFYSCLDADTASRFHLSARMCPEHRSAILNEVKRMLAREEPVTLISTQLIEAGVDVSFPVVFRAECGLDSLAQAAGRCNRHGELRDDAGVEILGRVYAFQHAGYEIPSRLVDLRDSAADASQIIPLYASDLLALEAVEHYFRLHIWTVGQRTNQWDHSDVMNCFQIGGKDAPYLALQLREAAKRFQMIPEVTHPLIIPWGDNGKELCDDLRWRDKSGLTLTRAHYRRAQRFTVQVYEREWKQLLASGRLEALHDGAIHLLIHPENDYDEAFGLRPLSLPDTPAAFTI